VPADGGVMKKGDLVRVRRPSDEFFPVDINEIGAVMDYRPSVLGGSSMVSYRGKGGKWVNEVVKTPTRGEVLFLSYLDGSLAWYDENNVELL